MPEGVGRGIDSWKNTLAINVFSETQNVTVAHASDRPKNFPSSFFNNKIGISLVSDAIS